MKHEFTLVLDGPTEITDEMANLLYEAGCDDSSPGSSQGRVLIDFHREAPTLQEAIRSAVADVQQAGYRIARIVTEETQLVEQLNRELISA